MQVYEASDYAGMETGNIRFYYGYERVDDDDDWCFAVFIDGEEVVCRPFTQLENDTKCSKFNCLECLMAGIAWTIDTGLMRNLMLAFKPTR